MTGRVEYMYLVPKFITVLLYFDAGLTLLWSRMIFVTSSAVYAATAVHKLRHVSLFQIYP